MESGILMIVIVVIGVFYPVYTAWISLVAAPVYLKIGFLFAMAGALLVMRILRKEKQIKWIVLIGILGAYAWSLYSWYDEECHYQYARSVHGDSGNALMLFVGTFTCLIPLFLLDAELTWWMESRKKKKEESPESEKETEKKENRLAAGMKNWFGKHRQTLCTLLICAICLTGRLSTWIESGRSSGTFPLSGIRRKRLPSATETADGKGARLQDLFLESRLCGLDAGSAAIQRRSIFQAQYSD